MPPGSDDTLVLKSSKAKNQARSEQHQQRIGPYQIKEILGSGGMGVVYRGTSPGGAEVAIKVLSGASVARFVREAEVRIAHPNIVRVLDASIEGEDPPYIVFELLRGRTLDRALLERAFEVEEVCALGLQLCNGLCAAHEAGVVHRDLKPANLFLCPDGALKILDFGIARLLQEASLITAAGQTVGTPGYLAPEQVQGRGTVSPQTDVWGAGAVLYRMLCGRAPFLRDSSFSTLLAVVLDPVEPVLERAPKTPPALAAIVERALQKPPEQRWQTVQEMRAALERFARKPSAETARPSQAQTLPAPAERRVLTVLLAQGVRDLQAIREAVEQRGGELASLVGDRAVGMFGRDQSHGEEARLAVEAGVACRAHAQFMAVAVGDIAPEQGRISGTALVSAERCCGARLQGLALNGAAAELAERFSLKQAQEDVFEVVDSQRSPSPERAAPFVGREVELASIQRALRRSLEDEEAQAVLLLGPAGIGKARLLWQGVERYGALALEGRQLHARAEPHLQPALSLFRGMLMERAEREQGPRLSRAVTPVERQHAVMMLAAEALEAREKVRCAEFLGTLLDVDMPSSDGVQAARADARLMLDRVRMALVDYFDGLLQKGPVALFLEELQWADGSSIRLLAELIEHFEDRPLIVLATARRPEANDPLKALVEVGAQEVELMGLASFDIAQMALAISGRALPQPLIKRLAEQTGGNPLYIEQILRALSQREEPEAVERLPLPLTVESAIQARLDRVDAQEKALLRRCAVLGRPFSAEVLEAMDAPVAKQQLKRLVRAGILARRSVEKGRRGEGARFRFRSSLVQEVVYRSILPPSRRSLHLLAARSLSAAADTPAEELARHFELGGELERAASEFGRAALRAARRGDSEGVVHNAQRAFELGVCESRFDLRMAQNEALQFLGRVAQQEPVLQDALRLAEDDKAQARALTAQADRALRLGEIHAAQQTAERARAFARSSQDRAVLALALGQCALAHTRAREFGRAQAALDDFETLQPAGLPLHIRALAAGWSAQLASARGDLAGRLSAFERAATLYSSAGDVRRSPGARVNLADLHNRLGAYREAERALKEALADCRKVGNRVMEGYALVNLGYTLTSLGRLDEARATLREAAKLAARVQDAKLALYVRLYQIRARLRTDEAAELGAEAEAIAKEAQSAGAAPLAWMLAAQAHLRAARFEPALSCAQAALEALQTQGRVEEDEIEIYWVWSQALEALGKREEAAQARLRGHARLMEQIEPLEDPELAEQLLRQVPVHAALIAAVESGASSEP